MTSGRIIAHLRFQLQRHGWPALVGLLLLVASACGQVFGVAQANTRAQALREEQAALRQRQVAQPNPQEATNKRLAGFYAGLPAPAGALASIEAIHKSATTHGVKLAHGEYRMARDGKSPLLRYQITLPARASYPQLRAWIGDVMNMLPTAALDEINFRRDDVGSDVLEARVRLTLFLRAD